MPASSSLSANVFVTPATPMRTSDGVVFATWPPIACTLVHGPTSALLINTPFTKASTSALADWIVSILGKRTLVAVYISHGLGDYFYGLPTLRRRFPGIRTYATETTLERMRVGVGMQTFNEFAAQFPGEIDEQPVELAEVGEVMPEGNKLELDGEEVEAISVGQGAVADSTVVWVPSLRLAVCGAVVYGDGHPMLAFCPTKELRQAWVASIEQVEQLNPTSVVCGHQKPGEVAGPWHVQRNKEYIETFGALVESEQIRTAEDLTMAMANLYPERFNLDALKLSAQAVFGEANTA